jgi:hypothetical protein
MCDGLVIVGQRPKVLARVRDERSLRLEDVQQSEPAQTVSLAHHFERLLRPGQHGGTQHRDFIVCGGERGVGVGERGSNL